MNFFAKPTPEQIRAMDQRRIEFEIEMIRAIEEMYKENKENKTPQIKAGFFTITVRKEK